jgi:hypothetical protein
MSGQPIGGNDSNTGTGTTLTQGADFGGQSASGQAQPSNGSGQTMTANRDSGSGQGTTSNAGGSTVGSDQTSGGSSGTSGGQGFIGSQGSGSDDYLQQGGSQENLRSSGSDATGGSDFASEGRGALDEDDDEEGTGSRDVGSGGPGSSV